MPDKRTPIIGMTKAERRDLEKHELKELLAARALATAKRDVKLARIALLKAERDYGDETTED